MRVALMVLDSFGVGAMPDAALWGDEGADTCGNIAKAVLGLHLKNFERWGLANIRPVLGMTPLQKPLASFGKMAIASDGKDTVTGHWEMAGVPVPKRFAMFPQGFPEALVMKLERSFGRAILGNVVGSGTELLERYGAEHMATGFPIVYTSADSVLQIAAHENVVPVKQLYEWCERAYALVAPQNVARVIARPFTGEPGSFERTIRRKDFAQEPFGITLMDLLLRKDFPVWGIGKIPSIFGHRGFSKEIPAGHNEDILMKTRDAFREIEHGLVFSNLVDLDMLYGHRRDPQGYAKALEVIDRFIPELEACCQPEDMIVFVADHGCDPTFRGTDHTREWVPLLVYQPGKAGVSLGERNSLADLGQTLAEAFQCGKLSSGVSFWDEIKES